MTRTAAEIIATIDVDRPKCLVTLPCEELLVLVEAARQRDDLFEILAGLMTSIHGLDSDIIEEHFSAVAILNAESIVARIAGAKDCREDSK